MRCENETQKETYFVEQHHGHHRNNLIKNIYYFGEMEIDKN